MRVMMANEETKVKGILKVLGTKLREFYGEKINSLLLYGSYARGTADFVNSDIDIIILLNGDVAQGSEITRISPIIAKVSLDFDVLISAIPISVHKFESNEDPFFANVREEAIRV